MFASDDSARHSAVPLLAKWNRLPMFVLTMLVEWLGVGFGFVFCYLI